ncbi:retrovirus-related Pol polyprotein from transposon 297 [Trichonephila clavipes]|nr:retrovirus-related Pol polyprotein from transposon 297 [Trichonephila clavipes]
MHRFQKLECPYRTGRISNAEFDGVEFLSREEKFMTVLDMLKGYWSILMEDSSKHLTAFRTHRGQYQWNVLPFGLRNIAATYQRAMSKVVQTISDFACAYIDYLAIFSDTWEEHLNHIEEVFKRLEHFNFSVNLGKCEFARQKAPTTKKQLRSALGLCNFYRQYIPNFAKIALPLTGLTKKKVPNEIPWSKEAENAFQELKTALCGITELQVPDIEKPYYLHTDASQTAVGCCLGQLDGEDNIHPIAFGRQKLNPSQQKGSTIEREACAIIWALKRFETLLCGAKIFLLTDHNPLVFLTSAAPQCPRLQSVDLPRERNDVSSFKKYKRLTISEKQKLIESVEEGERKVDVAKAFEIPLSSFSTILKNKEKIFSASSSRVKKRVSKGNFPRLEQCLVSWMRQCRGQNIPMGGSLLKEKAKAFANELGIEFSASERWLTNFKKRNRIVFKKMCGESSSVDINVCSKWQNSLSDLIKEYEPRNIFSTDETGLFFKCLPEKNIYIQKRKMPWMKT